MKLIIKADDFWCDQRDKTFLNFVIKNRIKVSLGVIGKGLEKGNNEVIELVRQNLDLIEPFNHSYWHNLEVPGQKEFFKTTALYQCASIIETEHIIKDKLNFQINTIGFPANACDATTVEILKKQIYKYIYYVKGSHNYKEVENVGTILNVSTNLKDPQVYNDLIVWQIHPLRMKEDALEIMYKNIKNYDIILPSEL